jgi:hypothetical protein
MTLGKTITVVLIIILKNCCETKVAEDPKEDSREGCPVVPVPLVDLPTFSA